MGTRIYSHKRRRVVEDTGEDDNVLHGATSAKRSKHDLTGETHGQPTPMSISRDEEGCHIGVSETSEEEAVEVLLKLWRANRSARQFEDGDANVEFVAKKFSIYKEQPRYYFGRDRPPTIEREACTLDTIRLKRGIKRLLLDAFLVYRGTSRLVQRVPFRIISIEGYSGPENVDSNIHGVTGIFVKTLLGEKTGIWLRLGVPSPEYKRYHDEFLWTADFGKHVVDYMLAETNVTLACFRRQFFEKVSRHHDSSRQFQDWASQLHSTDFRVAFNRHVQWLWSEATDESIDTDGTIRRQPIWSEVDSDPKFLTAIPEQSSAISKTIVTPYVYDCFKEMSFNAQLQAEAITDQAAEAAHVARKQALGFIRKREENAIISATDVKPAGSPISIGEVIKIKKQDDAGYWKASGSMWYLYVTKVAHDNEGQFFQGVWLYEPCDTIMATMHYPLDNELFFSDHCSCDASNKAKIRPSEVCSQPNVLWSPQEIPASGYFARQIYVSEDQSFRTLADGDFTCNCEKTIEDIYEVVQKEYKVFDTILIVRNKNNNDNNDGDDDGDGNDNNNILEPCVIDHFYAGRSTLRVRQLLRAKRDCGATDARPNELIWTSHFFDVKATAVKRRCNIKCVVRCRSCTQTSCKDCSRIPPIYLRNGQADCFFIRKKLVKQDEMEVLEDILHSYHGKLNEAESFELPPEDKLAALSLFCGGGNFDRGIEEAGAVQTEYAVEWDKHAAHTYRANCSAPAENLFLGSVDEHLHRALAGQLSALVPAIGQIDAILAGPPCISFSALQRDRKSTGSLTNASKIATVASYIDLWRPRYAVLENVPEMTRELRDDSRKESVFSQLICCLVGIGYQIQQILMDAWSYGEAQHRPRLFIIATAPGLPLLKYPNITHAHSEEIRAKSLGKAPNGQPFGRRYHEVTAFPAVSAKDATEDLPSIGSGHNLGCLAFPDHRRGTAVSPLEQKIIQRIPKKPRGQGLVDAHASGSLTGDLLRWFERLSDIRASASSKAWRRLDPKKLFRTITTQLTPGDAVAGYGLHWKQDRVLTVMEARRAQGFLDHEVIIGDTATQWKIIGNSVSRAVALALGMSLRDAWLSALEHTKQPITDLDSGTPNPQIMTELNEAKPENTEVVDPVESDTEVIIEREIRTTIRVSPSGASNEPIAIERRQYGKTKIRRPLLEHKLQSYSKSNKTVPSGQSLVIRLSQSPAPRNPNRERTMIIELDEDGNIVYEGVVGSEIDGKSSSSGPEMYQDREHHGRCRTVPHTID